MTRTWILAIAPWWPACAAPQPVSQAVVEPVAVSVAVAVEPQPAVPVASATAEPAPSVVHPPVDLTASGARIGTLERIKASVRMASISGGPVPNASAVVAGMAPGFRRCYKLGLNDDPNMKGSLRITAKIGRNGEVVGAKATGVDRLSKAVVSCVVGVVSSRTFEPPGGGEATIVIPIALSES